MARPLRLAYENALYHVISRGHRRESIFTDDKDREEFLGRLAVTQVRFNLTVHGYCLMNNHYHLLVQTPDANLSRAMHYLNSSYAAWYRVRHQLVGSVFQGRFKSVIVEKERYLVVVSAYIHLNPTRAGLVESPQEWKWSSMRHYLGKKPLVNKDDLLLTVTTDEVLRMCGGRKNYLAILDEVHSHKPDAATIYGTNSLLGDEDFMDEIKMRLRDVKGEGLAHMPEARRLARWGEEDIAEAVKTTLRVEGDRPIVKRRGDALFKWYLWALRSFSDMTLRDIATRFDMTPASVSERCRRMERSLSTDPESAAMANHIRKALYTNSNC